MVCISQHPQHKGHESETWWVCHSYNVYTFFFLVFCLGWLLHLRSHDCVSAQGKLSLSGLPEPRLQQKSGWPAEWHVSVWEVWQRIPQLQVPPHPLCKWFSVGPPQKLLAVFSFFLFLFKLWHPLAETYMPMHTLKDRFRWILSQWFF